MKPKKKKSKENKELKTALCDISKKLISFAEIDKKLEELANYCCNDKKGLDLKRDF
jgi:hypothetical protein